MALLDTRQGDEIIKANSLGAHLFKKGLVSLQMLKAALAEQSVTGDRLGQILVRSGFIQQSVLIEQIHAVDMSQLSSEQALITRCPGQVLIDTQTMILAETPNAVYLATGSDETIVSSMMREFYPTESFYFNPLNADLLDEYLEKVGQIVRNEGALIDQLLREALSMGASDVHILPREHSYSVSFRLLGVLQHVYEGTREENTELIIQVKDRCNIDIAERRIPHDGAFQIDHNGRMVDMRVSTVPETNGEKVVIRLLDPDAVNPDMNQLGITRLEKWRAGISNADGLCLICGPTGSGKTTTMNATVREQDRFGKSINTLEDPVEYRIPYITQVNINPAVGLDFARGLRALMRNDPDIVICGEIRDKETAEVAISASETGHMVLGTLHTRSIRDTYTRIRDLGVAVNDLRYILRSVMVQRLIRTLCSICAGKGCPRCFHTGYGSRTIIAEVEYFETPEQVDRMMAGEVWWPTMLDDAIEKYEAGITDQKEIIRLFGEPAIRALQKAGHALEEKIYG